MENFAQDARPTPKNVDRSLKALRKYPRPLTEEALANNPELLSLPFLRGISTTKERIEVLKVALELAGNDLKGESKIAFEKSLSEPTDGRLGLRFANIADEINQHLPDGDPNRIDSVGARRRGEKALKELAQTLLSPEFEEQLNEQRPLARGVLLGSTLQPKDVYEHLTYKCALDIDDKDPRKQEEHRTIELRMTLPYQRTIGIRYYSKRSPAIPVDDGVIPVDSKHTYLGTLLDSFDGSPAAWWMHFIHLGRRIELGEELVVETQEKYFDAESNDEHPHLTLSARFDSTTAVELKVRLPANRRHEAKPEARIVESPFDGGNEVWREPLVTEPDGWVKREFTPIKVGLQYGIFFPGFNLYKK